MVMEEGYSVSGGGVGMRGLVRKRENGVKIMNIICNYL